MRDPARIARRGRVIVALCLMATAAAARAQDAQPVAGNGSVADRSPGTVSATRVPAPQVNEKPPSDQQAESRGTRFWDAVWPFRPRQRRSDSGTTPARREESRARWLLGRDVRFAAGKSPDDPQPSDAAPDPAVTAAAHESFQPASAPNSSSAAPAAPAHTAASRPAQAGGTQDPADLPPALDPLPSPTPPAPDEAAIAQMIDAASEEPAEQTAEEIEREPYGLCKRFFRGYPRLVMWFPQHLGPPRKSGPSLHGDDGPAGEEGGGPARAGERAGGGGYEAPSAPRRAPPSPWDSPPFPVSEYQGYPLIGVPRNPNEDPLQKALYLGPYGEEIKNSRVEVHGWITVGGNWSNASRSNLPTAYWIVPNTIQLDQAVMKFEREIDWVQTDHIDWGFKSVSLYGIDYRYTTAGGWFSQQLLYHNSLYGYDPVEQYFELYIPRIWEGMVIRVGRWIACPDIETQYAPDNYLATHSLLFTYDTYTQTGAMFSFQLNQRNMVQGAVESGTDMAPWYPGALPTGFFGWRWVAASNNDAFYTCLNNINNAKFRYFMADGRKSGHDNFNYVVTTWEHRFSRKMHTKTEAYFMWQIDAVVGGTPSLGPPMSFGGGGGLGKYLPGTSLTYGVLNYTMYQLSKRDYFTIRNEWWNDARGERSGFASNYSSHTIGISHQFNDLLMVRPEIGYYHSYNVPAFDLGKSNNLLMGGFDLTVRF